MTERRTGAQVTVYLWLGLTADYEKEKRQIEQTFTGGDLDTYAEIVRYHAYARSGRSTLSGKDGRGSGRVSGRGARDRRRAGVKGGRFPPISGDRDEEQRVRKEGSRSIMLLSPQYSTVVCRTVIIVQAEIGGYRTT
jgi:hypothetical protein